MVKAVSGELLNIMKSVTPIIGPAQAGILQRQWQGFQIVSIFRSGAIVVVRVIDDRSVSANEHQMIRSGWTGNFRKIMVAERVLSCQREVGWNVLLDVLHLVLGNTRSATIIFRKLPVD